MARRSVPMVNYKKVDKMAGSESFYPNIRIDELKGVAMAWHLATLMSVQMQNGERVKLRVLNVKKNNCIVHRTWNSIHCSDMVIWKEPTYLLPCNSSAISSDLSFGQTTHISGYTLPTDGMGHGGKTFVKG